jgi:hypothetical protein
VVNAAKNSTKRKILTGRVGLISRRGAAKCGGVVVSAVRKCPDASSGNTNSKRRKKMKKQKKK